jgi:hypothetical protein
MAMTMIRRLALMIPLLLAGCSIHVEAGRTSPDGGGPPPSTVPNVPSAIAVENPAGPPVGFTTHQLQDALLDADDATPGWTVGTSEINANDRASTGCPPLDRINNWPATKVVIGFIAGDQQQQLVDGISAMTPEGAADVIRTSRSVVTSCRTLTVHDARGKPHFQDVTEPAFPKLGDETYAIRIGSADTAYFTTVVTRKRGILVTAASVSGPEAIPAGLEPFARAAVAKADQKLR